MVTVVPGDGSGHEGEKDHSPSPIDEIVREGAEAVLLGDLAAWARKTPKVTERPRPAGAT
jgi:hypothetical protein